MFSEELMQGLTDEAALLYKGRANRWEVEKSVKSFKVVWQTNKVYTTINLLPFIIKDL